MNSEDDAVNGPVPNHVGGFSSNEKNSERWKCLSENV